MTFIKTSDALVWQLSDRPSAARGLHSKKPAGSAVMMSAAVAVVLKNAGNCVCKCFEAG